MVAVLLAAFTAIENRSRDPLVRLGIFRSGALTRANLGALTLFGSYIAFQFLLTQYLQSLAGWSAMSTALAFLPAGVVVAILSTGMGGLIGRFGPVPITIVAFACLVAGYGSFLRVGGQPDYPGVILPAVVGVGIAFGLGFSALSLAATAGVADREQGLAASLFQTSFQVGGAIVLAIVTAVVDAGGASQRDDRPGHADRLPARAGRHHRGGGPGGRGRADRPAAPRAAQPGRPAEMMIIQEERGWPRPRARAAGPRPRDSSPGGQPASSSRSTAGGPA